MTNTHTDGHGDSKTNSAKRAELVKSPLKQNSKPFKFKVLFEKYARERPAGT